MTNFICMKQTISPEIRPSPIEEEINVPEIYVEQIPDEQNVAQTTNTAVRSDISDTEYNASAESNASSRRSSIDLPIYKLNLNCGDQTTQHNRNGDIENDSDEVGMLCVYVCVRIFYVVLFF